MGTFRNRALFREVNERILAISAEAWKATAEPVGFVCECDDRGCAELVELMPAEYEAIRAAPRQFLLRHGHESPGVDEVIARSNGYLIVAVSG